MTMPRYKIRSFTMVYYDHDIEAESLEAAVRRIEDGEDDGVERDNSAPLAYEYFDGADWQALADTSAPASDQT